MTGGISDSIERFIKELLRAQGEVLDLQRNELAAQFRCAPSQINYVLATRFTADHGYRIESRRGGGGYIRIVRIDMDKASKLKALADGMSDRLKAEESAALLLGLLRAGLLNAREAALVQSMLAEEFLPGEAGERIRARQLKSALQLLQNHQ
ncbi:MAG: CtsR family transcriptional regulator [Christensenellaceae bacterium]|jgi:transcriptional regulator CtsR|nr:CtsR family transcriptional regulator [Christensenellaceae bacterium]